MTSLAQLQHSVKAALAQCFDNSMKLGISESLYQVALDELVVESLSKRRRRALDDDASSLKSSDLRVRVTLSAADNGTGVAHSPARRCRDTGNEADNRLVGSVVLLQEVCSILLGGTTNLSNHDNTVGLLVLEEDFQAVNEVGSREGVTTDTDNERLAKTGLGSLIYGFVRESSGARDDADTTALVDKARHDTDLALSLHICQAQ